MIRPTPRSTRTTTLFPSTTLFRSLGPPGNRSFSHGSTRIFRIFFGRNRCRAQFASSGVFEPGEHIQEHRSEEHTSELQSLMRISYAVFCLKNKKPHHNGSQHDNIQRPTVHNIYTYPNTQQTP